MAACRRDRRTVFKTELTACYRQTKRIITAHEGTAPMAAALMTARKSSGRAVGNFPEALAATRFQRLKCESKHHNCQQPGNAGAKNISERRGDTST
jgi:hypothetical protein